jgi:hypothetical protein
MSIDNKYQKRVVERLKLNGLTWDDFQQFKYCGGDTGRHLNYWKLVMGETPLPEADDKCLCGVAIVEQCFVSRDSGDSIDLLVLGNCCIKRFMPGENSGRTCDKCGAAHRNRKINKCNECKKGVCITCGMVFKGGSKRCYCYRCKPTRWF